MLTTTACNNAKPKEKPYKLSDEKGMYLEIMPNGSKYWRLKYRISGKEKRLALGVFPEVSLAEARDKRDTGRKQISEGTAPGTAKKEAKRSAKIATANSFEAISREWLDHMKHKWSDGHRTYTKRRFEAYVFPEIGNAPIAQINAPTLLSMARKIESKGTIETAHKVINSCGQVFRYAVASGRCERDPVGDLKDAIKPHPAPKHMNALSEKDLPTLFRKMETYATEQGGELQTQYALQLLAITFVRTGELREAAWDEVDFDKAEWRIPAERMRMKAPHIVPLSQQALEVFHALKEINGAYKPDIPRCSPHRCNEQKHSPVCPVSNGLPGAETGHGFRTMASTILNEMGFDADVIERQLAHAEQNKVRAAYHRAKYLPERRRMMQEWADYLDGLKSGAKIIPLQGNAA